jgi:hypothetical protein
MKILRVIFLLTYLIGNAVNGKMVSDYLNLFYFDPNLNLSCLDDTIFAPPVKISPFQLEIVPPSSGVKFYRNGILFLSSSIEERKMVQKHLSFGSTVSYFATVKDTVPEQFRLFAPELSFTFPTDATTFSRNYDTIYYTRIPSKGRKEKIFMATYSGSKWIGDDRPLNFCNEEYIFTHPALSSDGTFIILSSDMPGTLGGLDLFVSRRENDCWGEPVNLGPNLNTAGNEMYASLDNENNLYYSSDGLPGEGGFDIFVCRFTGDGWEVPRDISSDINSKHDEIAFTLNQMDGNSAFYTSRLRTGKRTVQLCRITLDPEVNDDLNLSALFITIPRAEEFNKTATDQVKTDFEPVQADDNKVEAKSESLASATIPAEPQQLLVAETIVWTDTTLIDSITEFKNEKLIYRIQILASAKPAGSRQININGSQYQSWEYLHMGGYRTTIGEFGTLAEATDFQNICRKNGYNQAFIAAFSNNIRISDAEARAIEADIRTRSKEERAQETEPSSIADQVQPPRLSGTVLESGIKNNDVIYRVQILANVKPVGSYALTIGDKTYQTFEYLHMGGYRTTVGEFGTLAEATKFQNQLRQSGYSNAFVVAFKGGTRSNDPSLFR